MLQETIGIFSFTELDNGDLMIQLADSAGEESLTPYLQKDPGFPIHESISDYLLRNSDLNSWWIIFDSLELHRSSAYDNSFGDFWKLPDGQLSWLFSVLDTEICILVRQPC